MSKTLVTGGLGYIGSHLVRQLLKRGEEVVIFDITNSSKLIDDIRDNVEIVWGDIRDGVQLFEVMRDRDISILYHLCALEPAASEDSPSMTYATNSSGTFNVLEISRILEIKSVTFTSTMGTFGPNLPQKVNEEVTQNPTTIYGTTKVCCERLGEYYHKKYALNFRGVRFPSILGAGRGRPPDYMAGGYTSFNNAIIQESALGRTAKIWVNESTATHMLYVKDAIESLIELTNTSDVALKRRIYHVGAFRASVAEQICVVRKLLPMSQFMFEPDEQLMSFVHALPKAWDCSNALRDWGYKPKYNLESATKDYIKEVQANIQMYQ
ncbi:NAD-dependent epimerase/dehydratase family protein [Chloroflexota bacterium]